MGLEAFLGGMLGGALVIAGLLLIVALPHIITGIGIEIWLRTHRDRFQ